MTDRYDLAPSKDTYRSLQSDVSPIAAIKELVDNALDNWRRKGHDAESVTINISIDEANDCIRVRDDSGGVAEENIADLFSLGESSVSDVSQPIGAYGMGAKKAIVRLGNYATIKSRVKGADGGYGFSVDEKWLNSDDWYVDSQAFPDMAAGETVIEIKDLELEFEEGESDTESQYNNLRGFTEALVADLGETYERFLLGKVGPADSSVSIVVNGEVVTAVEEFSCSHTPYDGFHPRSFLSKELNVEGRDEPVYMDLKAGLLENGGREQAGTDVYIQNRKVISRSTEEEGGWTADYLGNYQPALGRTRFQVHIYTDGSTDTLPWDTQKSSIDPYDPVMREAFNFLRRAGEKFAVTYEAFPNTFTQPYPESSEYAAGTDPYDYSDRNQVNQQDHTPNENHPQASEVMDAVEAHLNDYAIKAPHLVAEPFQPGYSSRHSQQGDTTEVWTIPATAHHLGEQELYAWLDTIREQAHRHAEAGRGINFGETNPWWRPYYEQYLTQYTDGKDIPRDREIPAIDELVQDKIKTETLPDEILDATAREPPERAATEAVPETDTSNDEGDQSDTKVGNESGGSSATTEATDSEFEEDSSKTLDSDADGEDSVEDTDSESNTTDTTETDTEDNRHDTVEPSGPSTQRASGNERVIVMHPSSEEFDALCKEFDLPADGGPEEIGDELLYTLTDRADVDGLEEAGDGDS